MASRICWNCQRDAHMTRIGDPWNPKPLSETEKLFWVATARCDSCSHPSIAEYASDQRQYSSSSVSRAAAAFDAPDASEDLGIDWHPKHAVVRKVVDVPSGIDEAAGEAIATLAIGAYKAAVLMCRSVIEATAKDHDITVFSLAAKIDELEQKRVINPGTAEAAHEIRHLGNDMAHGDFATTIVTEIEAREVVEITEAILEEVYQRPARIARLKAKRLEQKPTKQADTET